MDEEEIKRSTDQILNDSLTRIDNLLSEAENLKLDNQLDRWIIHHCMLSEIPLMETLLKLCNYDKTKQVIDRVKKIAENLAPTTKLECFK
ncbi:MAG: hypothetical protein IIA82_09115 [Thaumarchaeota archaeon]|nr:hypothetical protein [Nitrososphaerota archaeon]